MSGYWTPDAAEVVSLLGADIESAVEMRSDYGRERPDWDLVLQDVERGRDGLDLGSDMTSPVVKTALAEARRIYRELKDANA